MKNITCIIYWSQRHLHSLQDLWLKLSLTWKLLTCVESLVYPSSTLWTLARLRNHPSGWVGHRCGLWINVGLEGTVPWEHFPKPVTSVPLNRKEKETKMCGQPHQGLMGVFLPGFVQFLTDSGSCVEICSGGSVTENYGCPCATFLGITRSHWESGQQNALRAGGLLSSAGTWSSGAVALGVLGCSCSGNTLEHLPSRSVLRTTLPTLRLWIYLDGNFLLDCFVVESG